MCVEISIVLPVYKNRTTVDSLYRQLTAVLGQQAASYELVFVDDACPQGSLDILERLAADDERVTVLALAENVGQNRAVTIGLAYARGRVAVVMDADLQDPPTAIPVLLAHLCGDVAAVFAGRRGQYQSRGRLLTSRALKRLLHILSRKRIPVDAGLFVAMRREMIDSLISLSGPRSYVISLMGRTGLPMISIPIERSARPDRRSSYTSWMRLRVATRALLTLLCPVPRRGGRSAQMPIHKFIVKDPGPEEIYGEQANRSPGSTT